MESKLRPTMHHALAWNCETSRAPVWSSIANSMDLTKLEVNFLMAMDIYYVAETEVETDVLEEWERILDAHVRSGGCHPKDDSSRHSPVAFGSGHTVSWTWQSDCRLSWFWHAGGSWTSSSWWSFLWSIWNELIYIYIYIYMGNLNSFWLLWFCFNHQH